MKRYILLVGFVLLALTTIGLRPAFAEQSVFKQRILPIDCLFEVIDVGTGTINYLTPEECGQIIPTPPEEQPTNQPSSQRQQQTTTTDSHTYTPTTETSKPDKPSSSSGNKINLDTKQGYRTATGYTAVVQAGQTYYFCVRGLQQCDTSQSIDISILRIREDGVLITITDRGTINLHSGHQIGFDIDGDGIIDLSTTVIRIHDDNSATMQFRYYEKALKTPIITEQPSRMIVIALATLLVLPVLYLLPGRHHAWLPFSKNRY